MDLVVWPERHANQVLSQDRVRLASLQSETVDLEIDLDPALDPVQQADRVGLHAGAVALFSVRADRMEALAPECHDGFDVSRQERLPVSAVSFLDAASGLG